MKTIARTSHAEMPTLSAFGYLLALYGENYQRLERLIGDARERSGNYKALCPAIDQAPNQNLPPLYLDVLEQHRHTSMLRLTHRFATPAGIELDPSAWVRVYHDSQQAEVTHCHTSGQIKALFSMQVPVLRVGQRRHRMNVFFNKWLEHLIAARFASTGWVRLNENERLTEHV